MIPTAPPTSATTRKSWHRVAEHVLAAGQYAAAGTIRLRPCPGGIETVVGADGRQLAVVGDELVVLEPDGTRPCAPPPPRSRGRSGARARGPAPAGRRP